MALPIILIDSATGSDTLASGAGPATALTGSSASTDGAGTTVTLDGSPDLSGVATDGSAVIFLNDSTSGKRNFGKITAVDNSAKTVTVADAFDLSVSGKAWAIGGKRASIGSTTSRKLTENNTGNGDWMTGWRVRFASGHSETGLTATIGLRRAGDETDGPMYFEAEPGASVKPILSWSSNVNGILIYSGGKVVDGFDLRYTHATKNKYAIGIGNGANSTTICNNKIATSGENWQYAIVGTSNNHGPVHIKNNEIGFTTSYALYLSTGFVVTYNDIHDLGDNAVHIATSSPFLLVFGNNFDTVTGHGINLTGFLNHLHVWHNTFYNMSGDGINIADTAISIEILTIKNNIFHTMGNAGINFSGGITANALSKIGATLDGNCFYNCTGGNVIPSDAVQVDGQTLDPQFTDAANRDFSIGTNLKAKAYPQTPIGSTGLTTSYADPGAAQRQEAGGSSAPIGNGNLTGGLQ